MEPYPDEVALLVAQTGPLNGQRWALRETILVGRGQECDIVIQDRQVSRQHARFQFTAEGAYLEDLTSKNGTHINGRPIEQPVLLQDGDVIQVALVQKFVYLSSDSTVPLQHFEPSEVGTPLVRAVAQQTSSGRLMLEKRSRRVWIQPGGGGEKEIVPPLSVSQFRLLEALYENQGRVLSRPDLAEAVWGEEQSFDISEQALDALVRRLRDRIGSVDPTHEYIVTVRGHGLRLDNPA